MSEDSIKTFVATAAAISKDYAAIRADLDEIKKLLKYPAYVVDVGLVDTQVANSLLKKITGRLFKPGEIIRLTTDEFELYRTMLPCPPRNL